MPARTALGPKARCGGCRKPAERLAKSPGEGIGVAEDVVRQRGAGARDAEAVVAIGHRRRIVADRRRGGQAWRGGGGGPLWGGAVLGLGAPPGSGGGGGGG